MPRAKPAALLDLGVRRYREVWDLQHDLHARVQRGDAPETWIFVEHLPVITLGRNAKPANLLLSEEALLARGIDVVRIERGGDVTYHGPGQLVVYPIRRLERFREVVPLVRALEAAVIDCCAGFGIAGERWPEHAGVWVRDAQICAIGLAVRKMTSLHGIALNVSTDLSYKSLINPCGLTDRALTSMAREARGPIGVHDVKNAMTAALEDRFGVRFSPVARGEYAASA